jgi:hypothetical protein
MLGGSIVHLSRKKRSLDTYSFVPDNSGVLNADCGNEEINAIASFLACSFAPSTQVQVHIKHTSKVVQNEVGRQFSGNEQECIAYQVAVSWDDSPHCVFPCSLSGQEEPTFCPALHIKK